MNAKLYHFDSITMNCYCTYFDKRYMAKGLAMLSSLSRVGAHSTVFVLCMDDETDLFLRSGRLPGVVPVRLAALERADQELHSARSSRSLTEYYFTCTAAWCLHLLTSNPDIQTLTYLDADLYFYQSPELLLREMEGNSILICRHNFAPDVCQLSRDSGEFNVGFISFRNDKAGRECLAWWRERCIEWCYDRHEDGRYADQKYLEEWPSRFTGVAVVTHKGANVGPWNLELYPLTIVDGKPLVDNAPIVFYHYHGVQIITRRIFNLGIPARVDKSASALIWLYRSYIAELRSFIESSGVTLPSARGRWSSFFYRSAKLVWDGACAVALRKRIVIIRYANPFRRVRH